MMINRSETCATRKLTQCTDFGVSMNEVTNKFSGIGAPDLSPAEFRARKAIVGQVKRWVDMNANAPKQVVYKNEWAPILYKYEASVSGKGMFGVRLTDIDCVDREDISKD